jgi:hypothetical protein
MSNMNENRGPMRSVNDLPEYKELNKLHQQQAFLFVIMIMVYLALLYSVSLRHQ